LEHKFTVVQFRFGKAGGNVPIPREQFEQGSDGTEEQVMHLLSDNPEKAFSVNEVAGTIYGDPPADVMDIIQRIPRLLITVGGTLDSLANQGRLDRKIVDGITYYCIHDKNLEYQSNENSNKFQM